MLAYRAQLGRVGGSRLGLGSFNEIPCHRWGFVCVAYRASLSAPASHRDSVLCYQRFKAGSEAQRGKPKGTLESEIRIAVLLLGQRPPRYTGVLMFILCGNVVIDLSVCVYYKTGKSRKRGLKG